MTPEERRRAAFEEFEELLREGVTLPDAIDAAARANELRPDIFRTFAENHLGDLEAYRDRMILRADHDRIAALASIEIEKCLRREGSYRHSVNFFFIGAEEAIAESVEAALGRPLNTAEIWLIEDMYDSEYCRAAAEMRPTLEQLRKQRRLTMRGMDAPADSNPVTS